MASSQSHSCTIYNAGSNTCVWMKPSEYMYRTVVHVNDDLAIYTVREDNTTCRPTVHVHV